MFTLAMKHDEVVYGTIQILYPKEQISFYIHNIIVRREIINNLIIRFLFNPSSWVPSKKEFSNLIVTKYKNREWNSWEPPINL